MNTLIRKTSFYILLMLAIALPGMAQQSGLFISGAVLDASDLRPLGGVIIKNQNSQQSVATNPDGFFSVEVNAGDTLQIKHSLYRSSRYYVPATLENSQYALLQLMEKNENAQASQQLSGPAFPSQEQFEKVLLQMGNMSLVNRTQALDNHLEQVTHDPTRMQKYIDDYMRYQQLYVVPEQGAPNNFLNPERWREFLRDWREGRFTQQGMEKLDGFPGELKDDE